MMGEIEIKTKTLGIYEKKRYLLRISLNTLEILRKSKGLPKNNKKKDSEKKKK